MSNSVSNIGILTNVFYNFQNEQSSLVDLNQQLASGKTHSDLTDYTTTQVGQMLDFQNGITQKQGYLSVMQNVSTRLSVYDSTMTDMENITQQAQTLATQNQNYSTNNLASLQAQATDYLKQVTDDLNQKVGDRYIYAGTRYTTAPVADLSNLATAPSTTTVSSPTLPDYDSAYVNSGTTADANAYTKDTASVDSGYSITYGIVSTDPSFQKMIAGLRYIKQATQETTAAAYQSDMQNATSLLGTALTGMQAIHTQLANNQNTLTNETSTLNTNITSLQTQLGNIQNADTATVAASITQMQTQLQASYSATASLEQLSLVKYL